MLQDLGFTLRLLNRHRGYALLAVLTLALGVGANTAVFSVADSVLFRPLPFADIDRLFALREADPRTGQTYGTLPGSSIDAARATGLFDAMAAASSRPVRAYVRRSDELDVLALAPVSLDYLELLGVRPFIGRTFDASDSGTRAVLLSHATWMRKFGGDAGVVGRVIPSAVRTMDTTKLPDEALRVVGVLPPRMRLPLVTADDGLVLMEDASVGGAGRTFPPLVRLKPGIAAATAQAQLNTLQGPGLVAGKSALRLVSVREELARRQDPVLWLLLSASGIVLLVACVNLANLIVARGSARARELAVRAALGGSRGRLMRLLAVESACIAVSGTAAGLCFAYWGVHLLSGQLPPLLATVTDPVLDTRALAFALAIACVSAAAFGILPAWRLSRADARGGLHLGHLQSHAPRRGRRILVALDVAICFALLVGAGLVGRSLLALISQDLGFQPHRVVATFDLPTLVIRTPDGPRSDRGARAAFIRQRLLDIRSIAGVRAAGAASAPPYSGFAPDAPLMDGPDGLTGGVYSVSSGFFRAMGIPLLAGRELTDDESFAAAPAGVLNETAARQICGAVTGCVGRVVRAPGQPARTVVGIVPDIRQSLRTVVPPVMYVPFDVAHFVMASIVIESDDTPENREGLKRALTVSRDARVEVRSLDAAVATEVSPYRFNAIVVGAFSALTLILAIVGVYGVMTSVVGERTREYGIRLALGATSSRVNGEVLRQAAMPIALGIAGGAILAGWSARFAASLLFGVVPLDGASFGAAAVVVLVSGLIAAFIPARRAGHVDPIVALRAE